MTPYDLWYQRLIRLLGVVLGTGIAVWETLTDGAMHPWAYFAAIAFIGLPTAKLAEDVVRLLATKEPEVDIVEKPKRGKP